eukprot:CAMPEP_0202730032 /NCGR_PEP_ID=MMETSP1385-20130828/186435_1 /ASSEMBLY_ACC=CAM_ASM_000861 /TAXON_ID=933848 /ORGANISM="Elphidium margaritaceum" /LENGTH=1653 /DNA_ID=CAMNT_0049396305 /DNA_START=23 /DNA_END=4984 /DNA_ORIENTATION=+
MSDFEDDWGDFDAFDGDGDDNSKNKNNDNIDTKPTEPDVTDENNPIVKRSDGDDDDDDEWGDFDGDDDVHIAPTSTIENGATATIAPSTVESKSDEQNTTTTQSNSVSEERVDDDDDDNELDERVAVDTEKPLPDNTKQTEQSALETTYHIDTDGNDDWNAFTEDHATETTPDHQPPPHNETINDEIDTNEAVADAHDKDNDDRDREENRTPTMEEKRDVQHNENAETPSASDHCNTNLAVMEPVDDDGGEEEAADIAAASQPVPDTLDDEDEDTEEKQDSNTAIVSTQPNESVVAVDESEDTKDRELNKPISANFSDHCNTTHDDDDADDKQNTHHECGDDNAGLSLQNAQSGVNEPKPIAEMPVNDCDSMSPNQNENIANAHESDVVDAPACDADPPVCDADADAHSENEPEPDQEEDDKVVETKIDNEENANGTPSTVSDECEQEQTDVDDCAAPSANEQAEQIENNSDNDDNVCSTSPTNTADKEEEVAEAVNDAIAEINIADGGSCAIANGTPTTTEPTPPPQAQRDQDEDNDRDTTYDDAADIAEDKDVVGGDDKKETPESQLQVDQDNVSCTNDTTPTAPSPPAQDQDREKPDPDDLSPEIETEHSEVIQVTDDDKSSNEEATDVACNADTQSAANSDNDVTHATERQHEQNEQEAQTEQVDDADVTTDGDICQAKEQPVASPSAQDSDDEQEATPDVESSPQHLEPVDDTADHDDHIQTDIVNEDEDEEDNCNHESSERHASQNDNDEDKDEQAPRKEEQSDGGLDEKEKIEPTADNEDGDDDDTASVPTEVDEERAKGTESSGTGSESPRDAQPNSQDSKEMEHKDGDGHGDDDDAFGNDLNDFDDDQVGNAEEEAATTQATLTVFEQEAVLNTESASELALSASAIDSPKAQVSHADSDTDLNMQETPHADENVSVDNDEVQYLSEQEDVVTKYDDLPTEVLADDGNNDKRKHKDEDDNEDDDDDDDDDEAIRNADEANSNDDDDGDGDGDGDTQEPPKQSQVATDGQHQDDDDDFGDDWGDFDQVPAETLTETADAKHDDHEALHLEQRLSEEEDDEIEKKTSDSRANNRSIPAFDCDKRNVMTSTVPHRYQSAQCDEKSRSISSDELLDDEPCSIENTIRETEEILNGVDDNDDGEIDCDEFAEAMTQIDSNLLVASIKAMYDVVNGYVVTNTNNVNQTAAAASSNSSAQETTSTSTNNRPKLLRYQSVLEMTEQINREMLSVDDIAKSNDSSIMSAASELNIETFLTYLRHKYNKHLHTNVMTSMTPKQLIAICFGDMLKYKHVVNPMMEVTTTKLWGVEQRSFDSTPSPLQQLQREIMDEADDEQTLDFTEFKSAIENLSLCFEETDLRTLFARIIKQQTSQSNAKRAELRTLFARIIKQQTSQLNVKRAEIGIDFFMQCIRRHVQASDHDNDNGMQQQQQLRRPHEILDTALRNMLRAERAVEHHLRVHSDDCDGTTPESSPNPYYDDNLMQSLHRDYAPDAIQKFEKVHSVKDALRLQLKENAQSQSKSQSHQHKLVHLNSFAGWQKNELDDMETELKARMSALSQQNDDNNTMMQVVHEDLDEDADFELDSADNACGNGMSYDRGTKSQGVVEDTQSKRKMRHTIKRVDSLEKWKTDELIQFKKQSNSNKKEMPSL